MVRRLHRLHGSFLSLCVVADSDRYCLGFALSTRHTKLCIFCVSTRLQWKYDLGHQLLRRGLAWIIEIHLIRYAGRLIPVRFDPF